jgi:hypothetical protein
LGEEIKAKGDTCTKTWDLRGPYRSMMGKGWEEYAGKGQRIIKQGIIG